MASAQSDPSDTIIKVKGYTINTQRSNVLGSGAYGIVFRAKKENEDRQIAAKRINAIIHPRVLAQDMRKLLSLKDPHIVDIFDFHIEDQTLWMFMTLCSHGDLNTYFRNSNPEFKDRLAIMIDIAKGIAYLHEKNVIHRDIKPANILISNDSPINAKLTDFDLCKFLDPDLESSAMNTNVGTNAFKAPEFFTMLGGKLKYHRNVDIYACALTYLALIQALDGARRLIPFIETPRDNSEMYVRSIGQIIAERIKYNVPERNIVRISDATWRDMGATGSPGAGYIRSVRALIRLMTAINPAERITAEAVLEYLKWLQKKMDTSVTTVSDKRILVWVESEDTVGSIKSQIWENEGTPIGEQRLIYQGKELADDRTAADCKILSNNTLHLVLRSSQGMKINVETYKEESLALDVEPYDSVRTVKLKIQQLQGTPVEELRLMFKGVDLSNMRTLSEYNIQNEAVLDLDLKEDGEDDSSETLTLIIRGLAEKYAVIVSASSTVEMLKGKIESHICSGLPRQFQKLIFGGRELQDGTMLSDYGVSNRSIVHVALPTSAAARGVQFRMDGRRIYKY